MIMATFWMPAVPIPCRARPRSSTGQSGAAAQRTLPIVRRTTADWIVAWRPKMSADWPKTGMKAVDVKVKAVTIQLS